MPAPLFLFISAAVGFVVGGIPFGYLAGRIFAGIDIRQLGSRNVGATNVMRVVGLAPGLLVLALDMLKGLVPVLLIRSTVVPTGLGVSPELAGIVIGTAAILGHAFTIFLRFRGGKGVATAAGVCIAILPRETVIALGTFAAVVAIGRYVSLGSICAAISLVVSVFLLKSDPFGEELPLAVFACALAALVIARHHGNIRRLLAGTENRFSLCRRNGNHERREEDS